MNLLRSPPASDCPPSQIPRESPPRYPPPAPTLPTLNLQTTWLRPRRSQPAIPLPPRGTGNRSTRNDTAHAAPHLSAPDQTLPAVRPVRRSTRSPPRPRAQPPRARTPQPQARRRESTTAPQSADALASPAARARPPQ